MFGSWLMPIAILVPLVGALCTFLKPYHSNRTACRTLTFCFVFATGLIALAVALSGELSFSLFELLPGVPIYFRSDRIAVWFSLLTVAMWLSSTVFSFDYLTHGKNEDRYCRFSLFALAALMGVCFSGNPVTTYLFYEMMTLATFPLVMHEQTKEAISAGMAYLYYSLAGAFLGLIGIFFLVHYAGGDASQAGGVAAYTAGGFLKTGIASSEHTGLLVVVFLMLVGFGSKVGMFPLHGWLPKAHPVAPAPASALLSGNITKMGILFVVRVVYYSVGADFLRGTWVQTALLSLSLLTVFLGSMLAFREKVLKKRLAYSTVSQTSYVLCGLYLLIPAAFTGAMLHVVFHSVIKNLLFLCAGAIIVRTGRTKVAQLNGIGKEMPVTMVCFTMGGLALVGIPPFSGFVSKWYLATGALATDLSAFRYLVPVILLISALLTAGYLLTISVDAFFTVRPGHGEKAAEEPESMEPAGREAGWRMLVPLVILAILTLALGIFPEQMMDFLKIPGLL